MNVYLVRWEGEDRVVEAHDFGAALAVWRKGLNAEADEPNTAFDEDQPDSMALISDQPVIR